MKTDELKYFPSMDEVEDESNNAIISHSKIHRRNNQAFCCSKYKLIIWIFGVFVLLALAIASLIVVFGDKDDINQLETTIEDEFDFTKDLEIILNGIDYIDRTHTASFVSVYGNNTFPILSGQQDSIRRPIIAGGRHGQGKFVTYTHTTCLISPNASIHDNDKLLGNIAVWLTAGKSSKNITAGIPHNGKVFERVFATRGIKSQILQDKNNQMEHLGYLKQFDFILINNRHDVLNDREVEAYEHYISSGGGLILATTPWADRNSRGSPAFKNGFYGNRILKPFGGIYFGPKYYAYSTAESGFNASQSFLEDTHAGQVWRKWKLALAKRNYFQWENILQMQQILLGRLIDAPVDSSHVAEIVEQYTNLLSSEGKPKNNLKYLEDSQTVDPWTFAKKSLRQGNVVHAEKLEEIQIDMKRRLINQTIDQEFLKDVIFRLAEKIAK